MNNDDSSRIGTLSLFSSLNHIRVIQIVFLVFILPYICIAGTINVPDDYATIQAAINAAEPGDEIIVSPDQYQENIYIHKDIVLRSTDPSDPAVVASTVIKASTSYSVVTFSGTETASCVISGFTITGGLSGYDDVAIKGQGALAAIQYNVIKNNDATGIFDCDGNIQYNTISDNSMSGIDSSDGIIQNNAISGNSSRGIRYCDGMIQNNIISGNTSGGLRGCDGMIQNNIITGNRAKHGGGLYYCAGTIRNNIIAQNSAQRGGGLYNCDNIIQNNTICNNIATRNGGGLYGCDGTESIITNCIIWGNEAPGGDPQLSDSSIPDYCCIQDGVSSGTGNIMEDPMLLVPEHGDFHLQQNSPCIDAGCNIADIEKDFEGDDRGYDAISEPRGDGSDFDIGADEFTGVITPDPTPTPCIIFVPDDYSTIQKAIDAAEDGCEIIVSQGNYFENLEIKGKNIILRSTDPADPAVVEKTVIDGRNQESVVTFSGTESAFCMISGFTITNGENENGGGIDGASTLARIQYNLIEGNKATSSGGGIYKCSGIIQNNTIKQNSAEEGGGLLSCSGTIQNNTITGNSALSYGGGLSYCNALIQNNVIRGNSAVYRGGGLNECGGTTVIQSNFITGNSANHQGGGLYGCTCMIQNNIIANNLASEGGGLQACRRTIQNNIIWNNTATHKGGGIYMCQVTNRITNCIIWGNDAPGDGPQLLDSSIPDYSCIQNWNGGGAGNITDDPMLLFPEEGDFHLHEDSPCIDAGMDTGVLYDFEGDERPYDGSSEPRGDGSDFDIGADEFTGALTPNPTPTPIPCLIYVPSDYAMIQEAIDAAEDGCEIIVSPGIYEENIRIHGKNIILRSNDPTNPAVVAETIINGGQNGSVVTISAVKTAFCVLSGFTITNGKNISGAGIKGEETLATIEYNIIEENDATNYGGGIFNCWGIIQNNTIRDNSADYGGGLHDCIGMIQNNLIMQNLAQTDGGGIHDCDGLIHKNRIIENSADNDGGGLKGCNGTIQNNTISGNSTSFYGGGIYQCDGLIQDNIIRDNHHTGLYLCAGTIQNNIITDNDGGGLKKCDGMLQNNTIKGNSSFCGGGVHSCHGTIQNNIIIDNSALMDGGGVYFCKGTIRDNTISLNLADRSGGGLYDCNGPIQNNTITSNTAHDNGGGLYECDGMIQNNVIARNSARLGGGLYECTNVIQNNTVWNNIATLEGGGFHGCKGTSSDIINCIIWENKTPGEWPQLFDSSQPVYSCIQLDSVDDRLKNINDNPMLLAPEYGNFHLHQDSPCIDAGKYISGLLYDFEGDNRPFNRIFDIGADEYTGIITPEPTPAPCIINVPRDYTSIQKAIDAAEDGCEIIVAPDNYFENIQIKGKNIILRSIDPTDSGVVEETVINGGQIDSVVTFSGSETPFCVLSGFKIINGKSENGGGISGNKSLATIQYNIIEQNEAANNGGGICELYGIIQDNIIRNNSSNEGGGLHDCQGTIRKNEINDNSAVTNGGGLFGCDGLIKDNNIKGNYAGNDGGGLTHCFSIQNNRIMNNHASRSGGGLDDGYLVIYNIITDNLANYGGGGVANCYGYLDNNIIANNTSRLGGGIYNCDNLKNNTIYNNRAILRGGGVNHCDFISNCIIWKNEALGGHPQLFDIYTPDYSCIQDWEGGGDGNIAEDPLLLAPEYGDFHLHQDSPCIDAGRDVSNIFNYTNYDFEGDKRGYDGTTESRGDGSDFDIGADEFTGVLTPDPPTTPTSCIIHVPADYDTIQGAIDEAVDGCEIIVSQGTYYENIQIKGKNIILRSIDPTDPEVVAATVINANRIGSSVTFSGTEISCILSGFTITNGKSENGGGILGNKTLAAIQYNIIEKNEASDDGGGIYSCWGLIQNNTITANSATDSGGGLNNCDGLIRNNNIMDNMADTGGGLSDCDGIIQNNIVKDNSASYGGGIRNCDGTIQNNNITSNSAVSSGGGISSSYGPIRNNKIVRNLAGTYGGGLNHCDGAICNNTISGNKAGIAGGGINSCDGPIQNNTISWNSADQGGGLHGCDGDIRNNTIAYNSADSEGGGINRCYYGNFENCIIWQNSAPLDSQGSPRSPEYCCIQDWTGGGTGNISEDPLFSCPSRGDFHLKADSPCIDAGCNIKDLEFDFEGDARGFDGTDEIRGDGSDFDMGVDEFTGTVPPTPTPTPTPTPPPVTVDNMAEYILGKITLTPAEKELADINGDGKIDVSDIITFLSNL